MNQKPFFIFNPKSFLYGKQLEELALVADQLASKYDFPIYMTGPYADLASIARKTSHIIVTAQHFDGIEPGRGMGAVLPESLINAGVKASFLNHAEHSMTLAQLAQSVKRAKELGIQTIVCADSILEARAIAAMGVDIVLCEPTELIGTGRTSDEAYIQETNEAIKAIDSNVLVMQAAGISNPEDVYRTICLGADGTGCTSGIVCASNPKQMLIDMVEAVAKAREEQIHDR